MKNPVKNPVSPLFEVASKAWWLEIWTQSPSCHYYFGPFDSESEVALAQSGYVEDLTQEGSEMLGSWVVHRHTPVELTLEAASAA